MAGILDRLKEKVEKEIDERMSRLEPKLNRMIELLEKIERNTRKQ